MDPKDLRKGETLYDNSNMNNPLIVQKVVTAITSWKFFYNFKNNNEEVWKNIFLNASYQPVAYSNLALDYQYAYQKEKESDLVDLSFIIQDTGKPIGIWPLSLSVNKEDNKLSFHGLALQPPLLVHSELRVQERIANEFYLFFEDLLNLLKEKDFLINLPFRGRDFCNIDPWHKGALDFGAKPEINYDLYIDLNLEIDKIRSQFRKSYKPLINRGIGLWKSYVLTESDESIWEEYRQLHIAVAGRVTRSKETWDIQLKSIESKKGFLVCLRDKKDTLVGGGFFMFTTYEARYDTAAYKRELFDMPLGHVVQYLAIQEFKKRGISHYIIGPKFYNFYASDKTEKELSISQFKSGFTSSLVPRYIFQKSVMNEK
ncbi:hypothetical protein LEP1GSC186_2505 [Leptospira noguchii serovar Autumnalis str. ZUN142]|uniref:BioF2-like acetyltransferase domain-containing protein n=2 Tax=Leptospira noguchii TaxID=28182 RepID=M6UPR6_9LEPT|nr:hypothetical protein LEP1GSC186_2505 [Leptospira noguchii serovar Autumnalis str. ZUN142]